MKTAAEVTGVAVNVDAYGVTVGDGKRTETFQIVRVSPKGRIYSCARAKRAAKALFTME